MITCILGERGIQVTEQSTKERIILAAIDLVHERGYQGATTKAIAERAGVNEVTLFRHFGNKKGIMKAAIDTFSIPDHLLQTIDAQLRWDLEHDLPFLVRQYHEIVEQKEQVILISLKEAGTFPELDELIAHIPTMYKEKIKTYFEQMVADGKIRKEDPEILATSFIYMNFGYFFLKNRIDASKGPIQLDSFIENDIALFIRSIQ